MTYIHRIFWYTIKLLLRNAELSCHRKKDFHVKVDPYCQYRIEKFFLIAQKKSSLVTEQLFVTLDDRECAAPLWSADRESGCIPQFPAKWVTTTIDRHIKGSERATFLWIAIWQNLIKATKQLSVLVLLNYIDVSFYKKRFRDNSVNFFHSE